MRAGAWVACALGLWCASAWHGAQPSAAVARAGSPPGDTALDLALVDWAASRSQRALEHALEALVEAGRGRARLVPLGRGREGRPLLALEIGPPGAPGVAVLPAPTGPELTGIDAALNLARAWLADAPQGDAAGTPRVVFVVGARPDLCAPALPTLAFDVARNFPVDWDLAQHAGGGPYPLAAPESRALAQWLDGEAALHSALVLGAEPLGPDSLWLGDPAADGELAALLERPELAALLAEADAATPPFGGLARHARLRAGLAVAAVRADASPAALQRALRALVEAGPLLELDVAAAPRPVGAGLWQVDVALRSRGGLGTGNAAHQRARLPRGLVVAVEGGALLFGAARRSGEREHVVLPVREGADGQPRLEAADLAAGATLELRLIVRAEPGAGLAVTAQAPRAALARAEAARLR